MFIGEYKTDLKREFEGYNGAKLAKDLLAGTTVAAVALPLALAFGVSSGATAASGLIAAIIAGIVVGALSGASFQISGPTGAMAAVLVTLAAKYGIQGIFISCFFAGIFLVIAGAFKLGKIVSYIPSSVITGFTSGIALIIGLGQLDNFFGVTSQGDLALQKIASYFTDGFSPNWQSVAIGLIVIIIMVVWPKKLNAIFPGSLLSLVVVLIFNKFAKFDVALVGEIPKTLFLEDRLSFAAIPWSELMGFLVPAFSIAALAMIESLLCGSAAGKLKKEKLKADRELIAQGIGNIIIPFFGGVPVTAAIARTSVVIKSGSVTRLAGMFHGVVLLLSMFVLSPIMSAIPLSALAGVLMVTAVRMNDWENIKYIFEHKFVAGMAKFFVTMIATVVLDLTQAIIIGIAFSALLMIVKLTDINMHFSEVEPHRMEELGIKLPTIKEKVKVLYVTGNIFFAVLDKIRDRIAELENTNTLIVSMRGVPTIDVSGIQMFMELTEELNGRGIKVVFTSMQPKVKKLLIQGGIKDLVKEEDFYNSAEDAILDVYRKLEEKK